MLGLLDQFEDLGYDMSAIRTEIAAGDMETARTLLDAFMLEHRDELPKPLAGAGPGRATS